jgi:phosphatidylserine decarboxylase
MKKQLTDLIMPLVPKILPKNDLSHLVGRIVHTPLPDPVGRKSVELFAKFYNINLAEAEFPLEHYRTIGDLFTRRLKPDARPVGSTDVVHPADAVVTEAGLIDNLTLIQAKGKNYTVRELLGGWSDVADFEGGSFATYYLCPTDYHRVHSPVEGKIVWSCHVPGELWPVNAWSVQSVPKLFAVNERIVVVIQTPHGRVALVMVAATNVGNMTMSFDDDISTQIRKADRKPRERSYTPPIKIHKGDEVGVFNMGSTVIMIYEKSVISAAARHSKLTHIDFARLRGQTVRVGEDCL